MKRILNSPIVRRSCDVVLSPVTLFSALWFKYIRTATVQKMPLSETIFMKTGVLPVNDHYYQPLINPSAQLTKPLHEDRKLPGINWNVEEQLSLLSKFNYNEELRAIANEEKNVGPLQYYFNNPSFRHGDGEYFYNIVRHFKPRKIIEIGCGYSTRLALQAETKNATENPANACSHICIEPYEMPWLEQLKVEVIRKKVEDIDTTFFDQLQENDILFIDSSHMIRPQGDVLFEFLQVLPTLNKGVLVHVHDVFTPKDYPKEWIVNKHCLWNEQYLLEAFLSFNSQFRILGALNFLRNNHFDAFTAKCPNSGAVSNDNPGSFWMIRS